MSPTRGPSAVQFNPGQEGVDLLESIESNTRRYQSMFAEAADDLMQDITLFPPNQLHTAPRDVFDVMRAQVGLFSVPVVVRRVKSLDAWGAGSPCRMAGPCILEQCTADSSF